jgi:hypothetical protein
MSGTTPVPEVTLPERLTEYGKLVTSVIFGGAFVAALLYAYIAKDETSKELLVGAVISNANTVVQFFLGSSSGSQKKDAVIGAIAQGNSPTPSVEPAAPQRLQP